MKCIRCNREWWDWDVIDELCPLCREELENRNEKFCKGCETDQWHEDVIDGLCWECRGTTKKLLNKIKKGKNENI